MYPEADDEAHLAAWIDRPDAYHAYYTNVVGEPNMDYINEQTANVKAGKGIQLPSGQSLSGKPPKQTQQEPEMEKDWNPFKSDEQKSKELHEKLDRLREENPKFFAEQDAQSEASRSKIMQNLEDRAAAKAGTKQDVEKITEAVMKQQEDQWQSAQQIGAQVIDAMMYNPSMIPGAGKAKGLYDKMRGKVSPDAIKDMKFDESGMPIHPKTGKPMDEKQMTQFYGDVMGSKHAGTQGFGQQVMNQPPQHIPPKPQQQKETNDKPV